MSAIYAFAPLAQSRMNNLTQMETAIGAELFPARK
jgi:hypothetical protein